MKRAVGIEEPPTVGGGFDDDSVPRASTCKRRMTSASCLSVHSSDSLPTRWRAARTSALISIEACGGGSGAACERGDGARAGGGGWSVS